ncbi:sensor histidine kinase [Vibrio hippocampi]|uniref:histidine kinase n=1 Tax=Vibrio hippocampi TaxID=654686 RepID=A0ABM8ZGD9_9VIBR|nr:HAMP domain-containing sensor histidine kinase [Vibrio hippocampi]CAH0525692.1 hypothetical protein VHP8226_01222 [Vibrio hippocampi]
MRSRFFSDVQSMTGRLALFFSLVSAVVGLFCFVIISAVIYWAEDRVSERRIHIDRDAAIAIFQQGVAKGSLKLDTITYAYNDLDLVPERVKPYLEGKTSYLNDIGSEPDSVMVLFQHYEHQGELYPIVVVSAIDRVETPALEFTAVIGLILLLVTILMLLFGRLLQRLSASLIQPVNVLNHQLELHQGDPSLQFLMPEGSAREFKLLAAKLNEYRVQADKLLKREQAFARYASHELRTPLTVIKGASGLLARNSQTPFEERQVTRIKDSTNQMSAMIDTLLSLVRYERDRDSAPIRTITAQEIHDIVALNQAQADLKNLAIEVNVVSTPQTQATYATMIIVLGNLLRNAIAASQNGPIQVLMNSKSLIVTDDGEGLSETPTAEGHGLGLLIVDDLCKRYGWRFKLENHPQGGCHASIEFSSLN